MKYVRILMVVAMLATSLLAVAPVAAQQPAGTYKVLAGDTLFSVALNLLATAPAISRSSSRPTSSTPTTTPMRLSRTRT